MNIQNRHFFLFDLLFLLLSPTLALMLRLDQLTIPASFYQGLLLYTGLSVVIRVTTFYISGLYRRFWKFASVEELQQITLAVFVSSMILIAVMVVLLGWLEFFFARSVFILDALLVLTFVGGIRFTVRLLAQSRSYDRSVISSGTFGVAFGMILGIDMCMFARVLLLGENSNDPFIFGIYLIAGNIFIFFFLYFRLPLYLVYLPLNFSFR